MRLPFVSRARFDDREREILELKRELADLKYAHARVLDEINFRSTGFHIDERFVTKPDPHAPAGPVPQQEELSGLGAVINQVGTRPSAIRRKMELDAMAGLDKAEAEARAGRERDLQMQAARRLEAALQAGTSKAQA